jgi:hypothetical protein
MLRSLWVLALAAGGAATFHGTLPRATRQRSACTRCIADPGTAVVAAQALEAASAPAFEAQFNPAQLAVLLGVVALPFGYWWLITVPEARLDLAKDKRLEGGATKEYIAELREAEDRPLESWFFQKWIRQAPPGRRVGQSTAVTGALGVPEAEVSAADEAAMTTKVRTVKTSKPLEVGPASPTLEQLFQPASKRGNPTPRFFSGDNPIVVTTGALIGFGTFAAVARENGALAADGLVLCAGLAFGLGRLQLK